MRRAGEALTSEGFDVNPTTRRLNLCGRKRHVSSRTKRYTQHDDAGELRRWDQILHSYTNKVQKI